MRTTPLPDRKKEEEIPPSPDPRVEGFRKLRETMAGEVDPREKARRHLQKMQEDPLLFVKEWLFLKTESWEDDLPSGTGRVVTPLWTKQIEILRALVEKKKVCVKSGHGVGKTFTAALASIMMCYVYKAIVITTAPTFRQVKRLLWGEIHNIWYGAQHRLKEKGRPPLGGELHQVELNISPKWYMLGFSTDDPKNAFQGFHEERILLVIDEACGVSNELYESAEGILTSEHSYVLLIGNPTDPTSEFANKFEPGSGYHPITISCLDSPNVKHGRNIYPKLVAWDWPERMKKKWGEDSPMYRSRVLAEFPQERIDTLIPYSYIQAALDRELPAESKVVSIGADIARYGDDSTCIGVRQANGRFRIHDYFQGKPTTDVAGRIVDLWQRLVLKPKMVEEGNLRERLRKMQAEGKREEQEIPEAPINVDDIGLGGGVTDLLQEQEIPCNGVNVGESPDWDVPPDEEDPDKFLNLRAQVYWRMRMAFVRGLVDIDDEDLAKELIKLRYEFTSRGKIKIMAKDDFKRVYGFSPDKADSMMLAWAKTESQNTRDVARWL